MADGGFMQFAKGWNQTVRGWGNDIYGTGQQLWGGVTGDPDKQVEGYIRDQEGDGQTERGHNLMWGGIKEMLGLVDHGPQSREDGGGGAGGAGQGCFSEGTEGGQGAPAGCYEGMY